MKFGSQVCIKKIAKFLLSNSEITKSSKFPERFKKVFIFFIRFSFLLIHLIILVFKYFFPAPYNSFRRKSNFGFRSDPTSNKSDSEFICVVIERQSATENWTTGAFWFVCTHGTRSRQVRFINFYSKNKFKLNHTPRNFTICLSASSSIFSI